MIYEPQVISWQYDGEACLFEILNIILIFNILSLISAGFFAGFGSCLRRYCHLGFMYAFKFLQIEP